MTQQEEKALILRLQHYTKRAEYYGYRVARQIHSDPDHEVNYLYLISRSAGHYGMLALICATQLGAYA